MVRKIGARRTGRKRKAAPAKRRTTRRRIRGISGAKDMTGLLQKAGGLVVGAVAARELNTVAVKMFSGLTPLMSGILQIGVGFMLPKFVKGPFFANVGDGMIANGGMVAIVSTGVISGSSDTMTYKLNGTSRLRAVGGTSNLKAVGGTSNLKAVGGPTTRIQNSQATPQRNFRVRG